MQFNANRVVDKLDPGYLNELRPGCLLQLQFTTPIHQRMTAKLVGYEAGRYLLVRLVEQDAWRRCGNFLFENNDVVIRMLLEGSRGECLAFKTAVRWRGYNPINMIYLYYPDVIEKCDLREHPRVATCIDARLSDSVRCPESNRPVKGRISDVSLGGCCFEFVLPFKKQGVSPRSVVIGAGENLSVLAEVRNQRPGHNANLAVGLHFRSPLEDVKQLLTKLYVSPDMLVKK